MVTLQTAGFTHCRRWAHLLFLPSRMHLDWADDIPQHVKKAQVYISELVITPILPPCVEDGEAFKAAVG